MEYAENNTLAKIKKHRVSKGLGFRKSSHGTYRLYINILFRIEQMKHAVHAQLSNDAFFAGDFFFLKWFALTP
jgi:hypothetical protein